MAKVRMIDVELPGRSVGGSENLLAPDTRSLEFRTATGDRAKITLYADDETPPAILEPKPGWTRYAVRAGLQRTNLEQIGALVLSEEDAFRDGVDPSDYEQWVDDRWGPGVTSFEGYEAALLMRGIDGQRQGHYASIGFFPSVAAREALLVALSGSFPPSLAEYADLIDTAFDRYLDRDRRRFYRLDRTSPA